MTDENSIWFGFNQGGIFVYDPELQVNRQQTVTLFYFPKKSWFLFDKENAKKNLNTLKDQEKLSESKAEYLEFKRFNASKFKKLKRPETPVREVPESRALTKHEWIHKKEVERSGKTYKGINFSSEYRKSHCWQCGSETETSFHPVCRACKWIVCPNCASCGCNRPNRFDIDS